MSYRMLTLITLAGILNSAPGADAADWPQYLGPGRNSVSTETGLIRNWPEEGPTVLWTIDLSRGFGGASIVDGKVYVMDREGDEKDLVRCLDLETGEDLWTVAFEAPGSTSYPGSRVAPTIDGNFLYGSGVLGDLYGVDITKGEAVWRRNFWSDYTEDRLPMWAKSQNPLVYGDLVIVASQTPEVGMVAYHKATGEEAWKTPPLPGRPGYVSPKIVTIAGRDQVVMITAATTRGGYQRGSADGPPPEIEIEGAVMGMDPANGAILWEYRGWQCRLPVPNVTVIEEGKFFVTAGYRSGSALFQVTPTEEGGYVVEEIFTNAEFESHVHPAVLHEGHLYSHASNNERLDGMVCMDLNGQIQWKTGREPVFDKGGYILADGMIISLDGQRGVLYLIEPSPEGFKSLAEHRVLETNQCWAPLALSNGRLVIRDQRQMTCVLLKP